MRLPGGWSLLALTLCSSVDAMADPPSVPAPESADSGVAPATYESYALRYKSGFAKMETRVEDYATTIEKGVRTSSGSDNTLKTKLSFTTSTNGGGVAKTAVQRETSIAADYSRVCSSISEGIFDTLLEEATGASISVTSGPGAEWLLEAIALPVVDDFGSRSVWGRTQVGVLSQGRRNRGGSRASGAVRE